MIKAQCTYLFSNAFLGMVLLICILGCNQSELTISEKPNALLTPEEVVVSQLSALQNNDEPIEDHGIVVAFAFASPSNKLTTGPLQRFGQMIKSPVYSSMINCSTYKVSKHFIDYNEAQFFVKIENNNGLIQDYIFELSKQVDGECNGCWMTEAVIPIKDKIEAPKEVPLKAYTSGNKWLVRND